MLNNRRTPLRAIFHLLRKCSGKSLTSPSSPALHIKELIREDIYSGLKQNKIISLRYFVNKNKRNCKIHRRNESISSPPNKGVVRQRCAAMPRWLKEAMLCSVQAKRWRQRGDRVFPAFSFLQRKVLSRPYGSNEPLPLFFIVFFFVAVLLHV